MNFDGLNMSPATLPLLSSAQSRSISAENFTGAKGEGGKATEGTGKDCTDKIGKDWKVSPSVHIAAGETFTLAEIDGMGAIQSMWISGYVGRDFVIRMYWDGQQNPSVECPMTDFFACGWSDQKGGFSSGPFHPLSSLMVTVGPNRGLSCFWLMPFRKHARVTIENRGCETHTCYYQINYTLTNVPEDAAYFHAQFRCALPLKAGDEYVILDGVKGRGHYVGTALCVGLNADRSWWGEGEIKFFLDGDEHPSICGTGTEDYFMGAYNWDVSGKYTTYSYPYAGMYCVDQPDGLYKVQQRFAMYRWHVMDPIRFEDDLRVTIQDLGWSKSGGYLLRRDDFASVAYWYQTLPAAPFAPLPSNREIETW